MTHDAFAMMSIPLSNTRSSTTWDYIGIQPMIGTVRLGVVSAYRTSTWKPIRSSPAITKHASNIPPDPLKMARYLWVRNLFNFIKSNTTQKQWRTTDKPIGSMWLEYLHYIYLDENHENQPNVGKYTIHGSWILWGKEHTFVSPNSWFNDHDVWKKVWPTNTCTPKHIQANARRLWAESTLIRIKYSRFLTWIFESTVSMIRSYPKWF